MQVSNSSCKFFYFKILFAQSFLKFFCFQFVAHQFQFQCILAAFQSNSFVSLGSGQLSLVSVFFLEFIIALFVNLEFQRTQRGASHHAESRIFLHNRFIHSKPSFFVSRLVYSMAFSSHSDGEVVFRFCLTFVWVFEISS